MIARPGKLSFLSCVLVAVACAGTGALLRLAAAPFLGAEFPFITLLPAVLAASAIGGWCAGAMTAVLGLGMGLAVIRYAWSVPFMQIDRGTVAALAVVSCCIAILIVEAMRRLIARYQAAQERLLAALRASGVGTWRWDVRSGRMDWDEALVAVYGLPIDRAPQDVPGLLALVDPRDRQRLSDLFDPAPRSETDGEIEFRILGSDGAPRWIFDRHTAVRDRTGRIAYMIGASLDITDRKRGEEQNAYLAAIVSSSGDAIISFGINGRIQSWNDAAETLFGYCASEVIGTDVLRLSSPSSQKIARDLTPRVLAGEIVTFIGTRLRKDGSEFTAEVTSAPILNAQGRTIAISALVRDISQRIAADQQKELLIRELHHRVRNTLATVQGLVTASARFSREGDVAEAIAQRIQALARTHSILTEDRDQSVDLRDLILLELAPYQSETEPRVVLEGPEVTLNSATAVPLSMGVHELVTNATKHGSLSVRSGRLRISWSLCKTARGEVALSIDWLETGGPPVEQPTSHGFGSTLLRRVLGAQLHAEIHWSFEPSGVHLKIILPMGTSMAAEGETLRQDAHV